MQTRIKQIRVNPFNLLNPCSFLTSPINYMDFTYFSAQKTNFMARKHPKALPYLFLSEMWERFGFYLMLGIFFLYMTDTQKGGMGLDRKEASDIFGTFIALVYLTPFIGGLLADRILGYRLSITIGGILMGLGYCGLGFAGNDCFLCFLAGDHALEMDFLNPIFPPCLEMFITTSI